MKWNTLIKQFIVGIFVAPLALIIWRGIQLGEFKTLNSYNLAKCRRIETHGICEDIAILNNNDKSILLGCDHSFEYFGYLTVPWLLSNATLQSRMEHIGNYSTQGWMMMAIKDQYQNVPISDYDLKKNDFHPHGISTVNDGQSQFIYVINHQRNEDVVSVFKIIYDSKNNTQLKHWSDITSSLWHYVNNLVAIPNQNGAFYITDWIEYEPGTWQSFGETLIQKPTSGVIFCESPVKDFLTNAPKKTTEFMCRFEDSHLIDANGITISLDNKKIYVVQPLLKSLKIYHRNIKNNSLTGEKIVNTDMPCDNINFDPYESNAYYMGCHAKPLTFILLANKIVKQSPSTVLKYYDNAANNLTMIFQSTGEFLSSSTTAQKIKDTLYISSVGDRAFLMCDV